MDDCSLYEGASIETLRDMFSAWAEDEYLVSCNDEHAPSAEELATGRGKGYFGGTRYNFFLIVDEICLESLDQDVGPAVRLVQRAGRVSGEPPLSEEDIEEMGGPRDEDSEWEGGMTEDEFENFGWMYMQTSDYAVFQESLSNPSDWEDQYVRSPMMGWLDGFEDTPGSWRK